MASEWFPQTAPTAVATPSAPYAAIFLADGTGGTTAGSWYSKDSTGTVSALTFSNEQAQDAVGSILTDTATVDFTYDDAGNTISAIVIDASITNAKLTTMAAATFKMRASGAGTGAPIDGTATQAKTALAIANTDVSGLGTLSTQNGTFSGTHSGASSGTNTGDQLYTASGDATAPSSASNLALTLKNTGPGATGPLGSASVAPIVTIDAQGRVTALSSATITPAAIGAPSGSGTHSGASSGTNTGDVTLAAAGSSPNANAATLAGQALTLQPASTSFAGNMSALDKKKLDSVWKDVVTDGGLNNTGASDNTALLQALHDALPATGGVLFFPQGVYRFDSTVNITKEGVYLLGQGRRTVKLCTSSATLDMFNVTGDATLFEGLRFTTIVAGTPDNTTLRTAGYAANFTSSSDSSGMRKCDILFQWSGIQSSGGLHFFDDLNIREYGNNAINGSCILVNGTGDRYITRLTTDNGSNPTGFAGIRVTECASCVISDSNIIHAGIALALEPANTKTVASVEVTNTFLDTSVFGMQISPAGTGSVFRCKFTNVWFGTHTTAGVRMNGTQWDGITFDNCDWYNTGPSGIGIDCPTGGGKWQVSNSRIGGFATGINLTASAAHFPMITNNTIGPQSAFGLNTTGITVAAGAYKGLIVANNAIVNNTTNVTLGAVTVGAGEASFYQIIDNAGYNPLTGAAVTTPAVPATTVVVTNTTGRRVSVFIKGGTITVITLNGVANATTATNQCVLLMPGGTIAVTFSVAFTWTWIGQ